MFLYKITPLTKIDRREEETFLYYGLENLPSGSLIRINFKNREINGIVLKSIPLIEKKLEIKKAAFLTKKISSVISSEPVLFNWQIKLAQWMSRYYLHPLGDTLKLFLPKSLVDKKRKLILPSSGISLIKNTGEKKDLIIWENKKERWLKYLEIMKQKKVLICFPEIIQLEEFRDFLEKHLNLNFLVFHGKLSPKQEFETWEKARKGKFSTILGTRSAIFLPFQSLDSIIIDEEENPSYKSWDQQPRYDLREIAKKIKEIKKIQLIKGVEIPRVQAYLEMEKRQKKKFRPSIKIIQIKNKSVVFEEETLNLIRKHLEKQFIFLVNRKGLAPAVFCQDCGYFFTCPNCDKPLTLIKSTLYCHCCSFSKQMEKFCPKCQSWRLKTLGIGTEMVKKQLQKTTPLKKIEVFDSYHLPNLEKQKSLIKKFQKKEIQALVATPLILKFPLKTDIGIIVLAEQFLNFPDFQIYEKSFQRFFKFSQQTRRLFIQTFSPNLPFFNFLVNFSIDDFYKEELKLRKIFSYPPFSELVTFIKNHRNNRAAKNELLKFKNLLEKLFERKKINISQCELIGPNPAFIPKIRNQFYWQLILKIKKNNQMIKNLTYPFIPSSFTVDVNPESLV